MKKLLLGATLISLAASAAPLAHSQQNSCLQPTVYLSVIDRKGEVIEDVSPGQFAAFYRGKPARILSLAQDRGPRRVLILLDASGSMESTHTLDFDVADEVLDRLPPGTLVGAMVFAKQDTGVPVLTPDRDSVRKQLRALQDDKHLPKAIKKTTALLDTIQESLQAFGSPQEGDTLYVISDGEDNSSRLNWRKLDDQLLERGIRVFAMRIDWTGVSLSADDNLPDVITSTGGSAVVLPLDLVRYGELTYKQPLRDTTGKISRLALQIGVQVRIITDSQKMRLQLPEPARGKREWQLRFSDPKLSKDLILIYQHTLPACPASAPND